MNLLTTHKVRESMLVLEINVISDKDLTNQARKMGRNAGLKNDGTLDSVHSVLGTEKSEGSIKARTTNPDVPDSKGLGDTERAKYNKNLKSY